MQAGVLVQFYAASLHRYDAFIGTLDPYIKRRPQATISDPPFSTVEVFVTRECGAQRLTWLVRAFI